MVVLDAIRRYGGILVAPGATARAIRPSEGSRDAFVMTALFVAGSQLYRIGEAAAALQVTKNFGGVINLAAGVGRAVLPPVLALFILESLLGSGRDHLRGVLIAPLVLLSTAAHVAIEQGAVLPGPSYLPELLGVVWGAGLAVWFKRTVPESTPDAAGEEAEVTP